MRFVVITLFPDLFAGFLGASIIKRACARGLLSVDLIGIRDFADPPHYSVDDTPYGGGPGMVMKAEPVVRSVEHAKTVAPGAPVVYLSPSGKPFDQKRAEAFSRDGTLILLCGRYEGVDQRALDLVVDHEVSIGDYVLMGGEIAAMAVMEATVRLRPDVLGNDRSAAEESFAPDGEGEILLEGPQYTKPREFRGRAVPDVLLSGDHRKIALWRKEEARRKTGAVRPELMKAT